jgi:hypothetical protein
MTTIVTYDTGGTGGPATAVCVLAERQLPVDEVPAGLADSGLNAPFVVDLLSACLAHGRCGTHLYRSVAARTTDDSLRQRYERRGEQVRELVEALEQVVAAAGGDPQYVSPAARAAEQAAGALTESTFLLAGSADPITAEMTMLEAVMLAEVKERGNWELLAQLAAQMALGPASAQLGELAAAALADADDPSTWAYRTRARMLLAMAGAELPAETDAGGDEVAGDDGELSAADADDAAADDLTRDELYARARELDVPGRSQMNKDELREAVAEHEGA